MKTSIKFALKANIGFIIIYFIVFLVLGFILSLTGGVSLEDISFFGENLSLIVFGLTGIVIQFGIMYFVVHSMLRDLKILDKERKESLKMTFIVFSIATILMMALSYRETFGSGFLWLIFNLSTFPVAYWSIQAAGKKK